LYQDENDKLVMSFLEHTFFKGWREDIPNWNRIELTFDPLCNLACKYCYLDKHGDELYPKTSFKKEEENAKILIDWLIENGYHPHFDIFAGEPTIKPYFYRVVKYLIDRYSETNYRPEIVVPTNYSFLLSETLTKKVEDLLRYANDRGFKVYLSASVDGKYCEENRPFKYIKNDSRGDKFYEKMFKFNRRWGFGFHPMIYANKIEMWKKNFLWFQENFRKYGIPFHNIYLLEVRNPEWHPHQLKAFGEFLDFLIKYTYKEILHEDKNMFVDFIMRGRGYNILSIFSTIGRGLGCSLQSMLYVRMGDLKIVPCHRTSYKPFEYAEFVVKDGKITGIRALNPELMIAIYTLDAKNFPYCERCPIRHICAHGCLGAQYEFTGDLFTPFPTLCQLELTKVKYIVKGMKDIGVLEILKSLSAPEVRSDIENIEKMEVRK